MEPMRLPWLRRTTHESIVAGLLEDFALERAQLERAHADALDRYRGRMRPAAREAADQREASRANEWLLANAKEVVLSWDDLMETTRAELTAELAARKGVNGGGV